MDLPVPILRRSPRKRTQQERLDSEHQQPDDNPSPKTLSPTKRSRLQPSKDQESPGMRVLSVDLHQTVHVASGGTSMQDPPPPTRTSPRKNRFLRSNVDEQANRGSANVQKQRQQQDSSNRSRGRERKLVASPDSKSRRIRKEVKEETEEEQTDWLLAALQKSFQSEDQVEVDGKEETAEEADDWLLAALQETKSIIQSENQVEVDKSDVVELDEQLDRTSTRGKRSSSKSLENNGIPAGSSSSSSSSNRKNAHYASPEKYAHLNPITDRMAEELDVVFCGINPGQTSGANGFHFSGPGNRFWPALSKSKLTEGQKVVYTDGSDLPSRFNLGLTDLVSRPTACLKELSVEEKKAAVPSFLQKISQYRPRIVCFMGLETPSNIFRTVVCQTFSTSDNQVAGTSKTKSTKPKAQKMKVGNMNIKLVHRGVTGPNAVRETIFWALASTSGVCGQYQISSHVSFMNEVYEYLNRLKEGTVSTSEMFSIELPLDS